MSIDWRPLDGNYQLGQTYREWVRTQPLATNAAIRSALQDFTAGTPISNSLANDIATNKLLLISVRSSSTLLDREKCEIILNELKINYNENALGQARSFLEGFVGLPDGFLKSDNSVSILNSKDNESSIEKPSLSKNTMDSSHTETNAGEIYIAGFIMTLNALKKIETLAYYAIFLGYVHWQTAISTNENTAFQFGMLSIVLGVFYEAATNIIFDQINGRGRGFAGLKNGEFWYKCWRVFTANFVASTFILLGLIMLIVPGIIFGIRYMFVTQVVIFEGRGANGAMKRSNELSKRVRGSVLMAFLLVMLTISLSHVLISLTTGQDASKIAPYQIIVGLFGGTWSYALFYLGYKKAVAINNAIEENYQNYI